LPRKTDSNNPNDWLFLAESDLEGLRILAEKEVAYALCRSKLAEILEKTLKAELLRLGWFLEKTHDLEKLAGELRARNSDLTDTLKPLCNQLAEVYFSARYPGFDMEDPDWPAFRTQLDQIAELHQTVKARLAQRGNPGS